MQAHQGPSIGEVVQIKNSRPRVKWKIGLNIEVIKSTDGEEIDPRILIPNQNIIQRYLLIFTQSNITTNNQIINYKIIIK